MRKYFEFCSGTPALCATMASALVLLVAVFPALPIGGETLDVRDGYTYAEALAALEGYGESGRRVYAWASVTLDTLFPALYASFLAGLVYRCRPAERWWRLAYLPLGAVLIDLGENIQIVLMLTRYPEISTRQVAAASLCCFAWPWRFHWRLLRGSAVRDERSAVRDRSSGGYGEATRGRTRSLGCPRFSSPVAAGPTGSGAR